MSEKQRLDIAMQERGLAPSREKARGMIMAGDVMINGARVDKPGARVSDQDQIELRARPRFVSRGGEKLAAALTAFGVQPADRVCADIGASTGGFTDCLLQNGAAKVYAIDVGYGILDYTLRRDPRVMVMERTNARYVERLPERVTLAVIDASFISLRLLLPVVKGWLAAQADVIPLIKPQFEAGKQDVGKGGVVKNPHTHIRVLHEVIEAALGTGYRVSGLIPSPLRGPAGNVEFLARLTVGHTYPVQLDIDARIVEAVEQSALVE
jgi:23S rRNA (cytidine1920-2'-O)/16S rRNA (cytidine1409-2'-O)-methyltransferase